MTRFTCSCGSRISTLKNLRASVDDFNKIGALCVIRGECRQCGKRYAFLPGLFSKAKGPKDTGRNNWKTLMFSRYLAKKLKVKW